MRKQIRSDTVYGDGDLRGILDKERKPIIRSFTKEAKGSETLKNTYMKSLLKGIEMREKQFEEKNEEKRKSSDSTRNGSLNVTIVGVSEL